MADTQSDAEKQSRPSASTAPSGPSGVLSPTPSSTAEGQPSPAVAVPSAPTGLTVSAGNATARLCWEAAPGADAYTLYYRDVTTDEAWVRMPYRINDVCYTAQQLVNDHTYNFRITGSNSGGESGSSSTVQVTPDSSASGPGEPEPELKPSPAAPSGLTASPGNATAQLCWNATPGADAYTLYYRDASTGQGWARLPYPISGTCYTAQQLVNGHAYEFRITGSNSGGESDSSNTVSVTPRA
jgi:hypothetical protein